MAYIAPIHQPSTVRHAIKLNFLDPDDECLVVAKSNRLEFYVQTPDGLTLRHSKSLYGSVTMLERLKPASSPTDHLFVGTDRYSYFTLSWDNQSKELLTQNTYVDLADKSSRDSQTGDRSHVDPSRRFLTLELYEGVVTIIPIAQKPGKNNVPDAGALTEPIPVRISEMFIRSSTFFETRLPDPDHKPILALLHEDSQKKVRLKVRPLSYSPGLRDAGTVDLDDGASSVQLDLELGASHLIPVPEPACGILILGETSITYYEHSSGDSIRRPLREATIFVAWEQIDQQRFIFADEYGKLYLLMLELDRDERVEGWRLDVIGETSRASVLVYLDAGSVFVGSHQGDSQVISIKPQGMDIVQTFPSIGPILDFTIMDMGGRSSEGQANEYASGQARLVTGSGAFKDGSLRSVRSGVGLEDLGILGEMENITNIFSVRSTTTQTSLVDTLIVSFVDETRVFSFSPDGEVEELSSFAGFLLESGTLAATNINNGRLLQVTSSSVRLTDSDGGMVVSEWKPPDDGAITAVTFNDQIIAVSSRGTSLFILELNNDLNQKTARTFADDSQIACIHVSSLNPSICIAGFWNTPTLSILDVNSLETLRTEITTTDTTSIPRSLLVANILEGQNPTLFVAMADGNVITFSMDPHSSVFSARRSVVLGSQEANFRALPRGNDLQSVFASCEHASLIYGSEGRLVYSAVTAENASAVCPFDSAAYQGAIAIATPSDLKLALIDEERSTHVQGLPIGETVRRIAYSPDLRAFGLGTIKRTLEDGVEIVQSHFKLADEIMFGILATFPLNEDELVESVMRCQLDDGSSTGATAERFVVGTAYLDEERADSVRGRIVVLEVTEDRFLKQIAEHSVKGACRCLAFVGGKIVAALIKTVVVFDFNYASPGSPSLTKAASYRTSTAPIDLSVTSSNIIAIADLMKSVSLVQYTPGDPITGTPDSLTEIARHFQTGWSTAVAHLDDTTYIEADAEGNLLVLSRDTKSEFAEDRRRLKVISEISLGEMVNKIRIINTSPTTPSLGESAEPVSNGGLSGHTVDSLQDQQLQFAQASSQSQAVSPKAFLATTTGSIYLFALVQPNKLDLLLRLQEQLAKITRSPGHVPFAAYRAFKSQVREADEPYRFIDGELLEVFLELEEPAQEGVVQGLGLSGWDVDNVRGLVEGLRRLR